jgi:hypothetical protein
MTNLQAYGNRGLNGVYAVWKREAQWFQPMNEWLYEDYPHDGISPREIIRRALEEENNRQ